MPAAILFLGLRTRRRLLVNMGLVLIAASVVTLRQYSHLVPLWLALCAGGGLLLAAASLAGWYLSSGSGKERYGLTAEPLLDNPRNRRALEMLASVATLTPEPAAAATRPGFEGGGASGEF